MYIIAKNECMNELMNELMNKWMNEWIDADALYITYRMICTELSSN
jgi:NADPH-dependent 7-cyano-7-deazaguanine reductase QueF